MFKEYFLYPLWLWLIPFALLGFYGLYRYQQQQNHWDNFIDKALRPFVISKADNNKTQHAFIIYAIASTLAILALSGPSLHKEEIPLYESNQGLVVVLDLSKSMLAEDVKPNRLKLAKLALIELLTPQKDALKYDGYVGLVVFAADAFAVTPLTNDAETIMAQLTHMSPDTMPAQGSRLDKAINLANGLLTNSGYAKGNILLVTDGFSDLDKTIQATRSSTKNGFKVSVLAVGTPLGAPIPLNTSYKTSQNTKKANFLSDKQGKRIIAKLDGKSLQSIADTGKGYYLELYKNPNAIATLLKHYQPTATFKTHDSDEKNTLEYKVNAGIWLLFPLLVLLIYSYARGFIMIAFIILLLPVEPVYAFDWSNLWLNQQQQAKRLLDKASVDTQPVNNTTENAVKAQQLFTDTQWKASAAYRAKDYALAAQLYSEENTATAWYNKGNALLNMQEIENAIEAYKTALSMQPQHVDANYNLQLAIKQQEEMTNAMPDNKALLQPTDSNDSSNAQNTADVEIEQAKAPFTAQNEQINEQQKEQQAYEKQWLKSIPDDPSMLWRKKFKFQYKKRNQQSEIQPW